MTWVYIVGGSACLPILIIVFCVYRRVSAQNFITEEVHAERARGIVPKWGSRSRQSILIEESEKHERLKIEQSERKDLVGNSLDEDPGFDKEGDYVIGG